MTAIVGSMLVLATVAVAAAFKALRRQEGLARGRRIRAALAAAVLAVCGGAVVIAAPAAAEDPEVCGYVKYDTNGGPTSTAPGPTYCQRPCGGWFVGGDPIDHGDLYFDAFACVRGV